MAVENMVVHIHRFAAPISVLGPGQRAVIWVQGCPMACPGCLAPEAREFDGGIAMSVDELAGWVLGQPSIEGITLSGGEPFSQVDALANLIDKVKEQDDYGVVCYTGYTWEALQEDSKNDALLQRIDLLIDGPYREDQQDNLRWRGSRNQRLLSLSPRYQSFIEQIGGEDNTAGMQFFLDTHGVPWYAGVPPLRNFRQAFETQLQAHGINLQIGEEVGDER